MRSKAVVGNWKLNGSLASNEALLKALLREVPREAPAACAVCVPSPYLAQAKQVLQGSGIGWGSQDVSRFEKGAYTGDVAAAMVAEFGARKAKLTPIFCVGETLQEREQGRTEAVLARQVDALLGKCGVAELEGGIVA